MQNLSEINQHLSLKIAFLHSIYSLEHEQRLDIERAKTGFTQFLESFPNLTREEILSETNLFCVGLCILASITDWTPEYRVRRTSMTYRNNDPVYYTLERLQYDLHYSDLIKNWRPVPTDPKIVAQNNLLVLALKAAVSYLNRELDPNYKPIDILRRQATSKSIKKATIDNKLKFFEELSQFYQEGHPCRSIILDTSILYGYHGIEMFFMNARIRMEQHNTTAYGHIQELQKITLSNYALKKPNFSESDCRLIAVHVQILTARIINSVLTEKDITQFEEAMQKYHSCSRFTRICALIVGTLLGMVAAAAVGAMVSTTGMLAAGAVGAAIGFKAAERLTMWYSYKQIRAKNSDLVNSAESFIASIRR